MINRLHFILDDQGEPRPCDDVLVWGLWFETAERTVKQTTMVYPDGVSVLVSTVFLGLNHNFHAIGLPVLWETLVFDGPLDGEMERYTSRAAALAGHQAMCARVRETMP
jgi:hypothetical protein